MDADIRGCSTVPKELQTHPPDHTTSKKGGRRAQVQVSRELKSNPEAMAYHQQGTIN